MTAGDGTESKGRARAERMAREAAALRENLKRRKSQARARADVAAEAAPAGDGREARAAEGEKAAGDLAEKRGKP